MREVSRRKLAVSRYDMFTVDPRTICEREGFNARFSYTGIEELAKSIETTGLRRPLKICVENGRPTLIDGHRRMRAIKLLLERGVDVPPVKCEFESTTATELDKLTDLIVQNGGEPLNQLEEGHVFVRMLSEGAVQTVIADRVGKTQGHVSNCLALATTSDRIQQLIKENRVSCSTVLKVIRVEKDEEKQWAILNGAVEEVGAEDGGSREAAAAVRERVAKETPSTRLKALNEWADAHAIIFEEGAKFRTMNMILSFLKGNLTLEEIDEHCREDFDD